MITIDHRDKSVLVTGAGAGIGREIGPLALEEFFQLKSIQR